MLRGTAITIFVFIALFLVLVMVPIWVKGAKCHARWVDRETYHSWLTGCLVEYEGTLVPEDRVWFERNR